MLGRKRCRADLGRLPSSDRCSGIGSGFAVPLLLPVLPLTCKTHSAGRRTVRYTAAQPTSPKLLKRWIQALGRGEMSMVSVMIGGA